MIGMVIIALLSPVLGTIADLKGDKKKMLGGFLALGIVSVAGMFFIYQGDWILASVLFILANIGANGSFVFYDALVAACRPRRRDGPGFDGRLCARLYRRRHAAGAQPGVDHEAGVVRAALGRDLVAAQGRFPRGWRSSRSRSGGWSFRSRCFGGCQSRCRWRRASDRASHPGGVRALVGDGPGPARPQTSISDAARVPDLQRRHRHDHPHGDASTAPRSGSIRSDDDRRDHDRAVCRHSVRVSLRDAGPSHRRQAIDRRGAGRVHGDLRFRLFHEELRPISWCWRSWSGRCRGERRP